MKTAAYPLCTSCNRKGWRLSTCPSIELNAIFLSALRAWLRNGSPMKKLIRYAQGCAVALALVAKVAISLLKGPRT